MKIAWIMSPFKDEKRDIWSNIPLCLKEFPRAKPKGTPEGEGVYLTVYTESSPNTDSISFFKKIQANDYPFNLIDN